MDGRYGKNKMESMPMKQLVWDMSLPMMISLLIQSLYNIVDSMFVARLSMDALTATSLAYPVQMLMISVGVGSAVGLNAVLSKALGARKSAEASAIATTGLILAFFWGIVFGICGLLFSEKLAYMFTNATEIAELCKQYLFICMLFSLGNMVCMTCQRLMQATGKTLLSMLILVVGAVTNIILDPIMIFGLLGCPAMGIRGAAIATVIGQWVSMITGLILQKCRNKEVKIGLKGFHLKMQYVKAIYKVGFPTIITQAMQSMMVTCFNALLQPFSTAAVAFFGVYYKLQSFLFMPMNGLGQASIPIVGFNFGAKDKKRISEAMRVLYPAAVIVAFAGTVLFELIPGQLLAIFTDDTELLAVGIPAIRIIAPTFVPASITMISGYLASGLQDGVTNMISALVRQFIPLVPCAMILAQCGGIGAVWFAFWISEICAMLYGVIRMRQLMKKKVQPL